MFFLLPLSLDPIPFFSRDASSTVLLALPFLLLTFLFPSPCPHPQTSLPHQHSYRYIDPAGRKYTTALRLYRSMRSAALYVHGVFSTSR